jgi:pimeloyl-ACP methyl ester carboxylesterase
LRRARTPPAGPARARRTPGRGGGAANDLAPEGGRPHLVLIPGTLCDRRVFDAQAHALRGVARVWCAELRGLDDVGRWAERLLRRLPPRFSLAGFSLGGLLALELLRRAPERVERLALIASNAEAGSRRASHRSRAQQARLQRGGTPAVARTLLPAYLPVPRRRARHAPLIRRMAADTPAAAARMQFDWAAQRPAGRALLAAHAAPLLIVSGADDRHCPRAQQQRLHATRPDARWLELRRCGHFIPLEQAAALGRALARWLALPPAPRPGDTE